MFNELIKQKYYHSLQRTIKIARLIPVFVGTVEENSTRTGPDKRHLFPTGACWIFSSSYCPDAEDGQRPPHLKSRTSEHEVEGINVFRWLREAANTGKITRNRNVHKDNLKPASGNIRWPLLKCQDISHISKPRHGKVKSVTQGLWEEQRLTARRLPHSATLQAKQLENIFLVRWPQDSRRAVSDHHSHLAPESFPCPLTVKLLNSD